MNTLIYTTSFDGDEFRFVLVGSDVFVSRHDLIASMKKCFTEDIQHLVDIIIDGGLKIVGDDLDRKSAIIGDSVIGPVVHFHAVGNILSTLSTMENVDSYSLRESCRRTAALTQWYAEALSQADSYFGRDIVDLLSSVRSRLDRVAPAHVVNVYHEDGIWTAVCDDLGLVTESESYDGLTSRVWEIAEDLIHENGIADDIGDIRLSFVQLQEAEGRMAL